MARYIDADQIYYEDVEFAWGIVKNMTTKVDVDRVPTADVEPVRKHGKMVIKERERLIPDDPPTASVDEFGFPFIVRHHKIVKYFYCPFCNNELRDGLVKYCDECGAKMDEEVSDGQP